MKIATSFLAALLLTGALGAINTAMAADGVVSKDELAPDSYCHEKFPRCGRALTTMTALKNSSPATVIDFYGPCNENPIGKDQDQAQNSKTSIDFRWNYSDWC